VTLNVFKQVIIYHGGYLLPTGENTSYATMYIEEC
jgi:hypothetical protein